MTTASRTDDELTTLSTLRVDERELSRRLQETRRSAEASLFDAREAAARVEALAEADGRQELARLRQERGRQLEAELAAVQEETTQQLTALVRRSATNRERVLTRLLAAVTGSSTP